MTTPSRAALSGPILLLALVGTMTSVGCADDGRPPTTSVVFREGVENVLHDMRTYITYAGVRRARVEADTAELLTVNEIRLRPLKLVFFDGLGQPSVEVTADSGIYYELAGEVAATGSVVAIDSVQGQRLETEFMRYASSQGRIYGPSPFQLFRDGAELILRGDAFESDVNMDSVTIMNPSGEGRPSTLRSTPVGPVTSTPEEIPPDDAPGQPELEGEEPLDEGLPANPDSTSADSAGAMADPDSLSLEEANAMVDTDSAMVDPDSVVVEPDSAVADPDSILATPDSLEGVADPDTLPVSARGS